jgi:hypothetical protein
MHIRTAFRLQPEFVAAAATLGCTAPQNTAAHPAACIGNLPKDLPLACLLLAQCDGISHHRGRNHRNCCPSEAHAGNTDAWL